MMGEKRGDVGREGEEEEYLSNFEVWRERLELHKWAALGPNLAIKRPIDVPLSHPDSFAHDVAEHVPAVWLIATLQTRSRGAGRSQRIGEEAREDV